MVITKVTGGLGNQMFQYAAGRALALKLGTTLRVDPSFYQEQATSDIAHQRQYLLNQYFTVAATLLSAAEHQQVERYLHHPAYRLYKKSREALGLPSPFTFYQEKTYAGYEPGVHGVRGQLIYLVGGFQNERYFSDFLDTIRQEFTFKHLDAQNVALAQQMQQQNAVAVHIRRGDYVMSQYHNTCGPDYYERAMRQLEETVPAPYYYLFSDDSAWVRDNLRLPTHHQFVTHNTGDNSYQDMYLMSQCKHNIIANSSFSWWGAWLNQHPHKLVIAPEEWLAYHQVKARAIVPDTWQVL